MTRGIYVIRHEKTGWCYIGMSARIEARWKEHRQALVKAKHHCRPLQAVWTHDGPDAFTFEVVEEVADYEAIGERETHWYKKLAAVDIWNVDLEAAGYRAATWEIGRPSIDYELTVRFRLGEYDAFHLIPVLRTILRKPALLRLVDQDRWAVKIEHITEVQLIRLEEQKETA